MRFLFSFSTICDLLCRHNRNLFRIDSGTRCTYNIHTADLRFIWDKQKNALNYEKHGVAFEEAQTAFSDEFGRLIHDSLHSDDEDRFVLLGLSSALRLLLVCHCYKESDSTVR